MNNIIRSVTLKKVECENFSGLKTNQITVKLSEIFVNIMYKNVLTSDGRGRGGGTKLQNLNHG